MTNFEEFRTTWLYEVQEGQPSTVELGRRFALKLVTQWLDISDTAADLTFCDGSGDGGIDIALLDTGADDTSEEVTPRHNWYLIQSKYGAAFAGTDTLLVEGNKVIETLDGKRSKLNSLAEGVLERLTNFRKKAGQNDKITLVYATEIALTDKEKQTLNDIRTIGASRLGSIFDVESISIESIYARLQDEQDSSNASKLAIDITAHLSSSGDDLLVGSIGILNLYDFLKQYREQTGDLDRLYEKNVRRFLGGRGKVNKAMQKTLRDSPEKFGLYNNGITIVVNEYTEKNEILTLIDPYIVNGCQTTRTIWEVCHNRLNTGGTGLSPDIENWKIKAENGVVVAKIVKIGNSGEKLLQAITRYTNSQNAIREKDFLALTDDFRTWQAQLAETYNIYLEIQRGGWDSQKALQNTNHIAKRFTEYANAADLIKVYGAAWLGEAGTAFGKNAPFLPDGSIFKKIMAEDDSNGGPFGVDDLYAAYLLQRATNEFDFGRGAEKITRRQTRFLFLMITIELFKDVLSRLSMPQDNRTISTSIVKVLESNDAKLALLNQAAEVVDSYLTHGSDENVFNEPVYISFNHDMNAFLKWDKLGKQDADTPRLKQAIAINKSVMGRQVGNTASPRQIIADAITNPN